MSDNVTKTFRIPVESTTITDFTHRKAEDPNHQLLVTDKINVFLESHLKQHGCDIPDDFNLELSELVYNAYDAYVKKELVIGGELLITVSVKNTKDKVRVTIQDNGGGFRTARPGKQFGPDDLVPDEKPRHSCSGGERKGLIDFTTMLKSHNIGFFLSNTEDSLPGALVTMEFPKQQKDQPAPSKAL